MRRILLGLLVVASGVGVAAAAQGEPPRGPNKALGYLPVGGVAYGVVTSDLSGQPFRTLDSRLVRPIVGVRVASLVEDGLEELDGPGTYDRDIRAQLGNDIVVAVRWPTLLRGREGIVVALQIKDARAMRAALDRARLLRIAGSAGPAVLYAERKQREAFLALDGDVLVAADSERRLRRALARKAAGAGLTEAGLATRLGELPKDAPIRVAGDAPSLLAQPDLGRLRRVPWFAATRSFGATLSAASGRITADAVVRTDPARVTDAQLPLQPGDGPPALAPTLKQFASGSLNQSQTTAFLLRAARARFPRSAFVRDVRRVERALRINFEREVLRQFNGPSATLLAPNGRFAARSQVRDPARMARTLRRLAPHLGRLVHDLQSLGSEATVPLLLLAPDAPVAAIARHRAAIKVRRLRGDLYRVSGRSAGRRVLFVIGLHRGVFVVGSSERRAKEIATMRLAVPRGPLGGSILRANVGGMREGLERVLGFDSGRLGELVGSLRSSRSELRGSLSVELR